MKFKFSKQTVERVKNNWLYRENDFRFIDCKTDSDKCIEFALLSKEKGNETSLGFDISSQIVSQMMRK